MEFPTAERTEENYARLRCFECEEMGETAPALRFISKDRFVAELSNPNRGWKCPSCGSHPCGFDDEFFEQVLVAK